MSKRSFHNLFKYLWSKCILTSISDLIMSIHIFMRECLPRLKNGQINGCGYLPTPHPTHSLLQPTHKDHGIGKLATT